MIARQVILECKFLETLIRSVRLTESCENTENRDHQSADIVSNNDSINILGRK